MSSLARFLFVEPSLRRLKAWTWCIATTTDLAILWDLFTRRHPPGSIDLPRLFVVATLVTLLFAGLEWMFTFPVSPRWLGRTPVAMTVQFLSLAVVFLFWSYDWVSHARGTDVWRDPTGCLRGGDWTTIGTLDEYVYSFKVALVAAFARLPLAYAFRRSLKSPGHHSCERLSIGLGFSLLVLACAGTSDLFSISEACLVPRAVTSTSLDFTRSALWFFTCAVGLGLSVAGLALALTRRSWLRRVQGGHVPGWRITPVDTDRVKPERAFTRSWFSPLGAVLEREQFGSWQSFAQVPVAFSQGDNRAGPQLRAR